MATETINENVFQRNKSTILTAIIVILLLIIGFGYFQLKSSHKEELSAKENYNNALVAQMKTYRDKNGILYNEKLTLQTSLKQLEQDRDNGKLNADKKELLARIEASGRKKDIIAAALVKAEVKTKKIVIDKPSVVRDSSISFSYNSDTINVDLTVKNVVGIKGRKPALFLDSISLKNTVYVQYDWGKRTEGYPVSFTISNSNPLFKTSNVESYIIPEVVKDKVRPGLVKRVGKFIVTKAVPIVAGVASGVATGALAGPAVGVAVGVGVGTASSILLSKK